MDDKNKICDEYLLFYHSLPPEGQSELVNCSNSKTVIDLARRYNYPLSEDECVAIYYLLARPDYFWRRFKM